MRPIYLSLTKKGSFEAAIKQLEHYKERLDQNCEEFVRRLMEIGVETAEDNTGRYRGLIVFHKHLYSDDSWVDGVIVATDGTKLIREWYHGGEIVSYEVSPLLLAEFGSGWLAKVLDHVPGVGQGTMPGAYGHAFDKDGWSWVSPDGEKHHSFGEAPTYPMHTAVYAMMFEIDRIGREVFGNG